MSRRITVPFFIPHHGCPHHCVFCDQLAISGAAPAIPSPALIGDTIEAYRASSRQSCVDVAFFGGTFTLLPSSVQESLLVFVHDLQRQGVVGTVRISTRPDAIDRSTCCFLKEHGVGIVELGVQSLDDNVLVQAGRGHCAADVAKAVNLLLGEDLRVGVQLMVGLPGDNDDSCFASVRRALDLGPHFLRIYPTLVLAGTALAELYQRGEYIPLSLDHAVGICADSLRIAQEAGVPVIRVGLQPTEELAASGCILAGPYHPAFGQLVQSRLWYDLLTALTEPRATATVRCPTGRFSDVVGQRRSNIHRLLKERGVVVTVETDPLLGPQELEVTTGGVTRKGHIMTGIDSLPEVA